MKEFADMTVGECKQRFVELGVELRTCPLEEAVDIFAKLEWLKDTLGALLLDELGEIREEVKV